MENSKKGESKQTSKSVPEESAQKELFLPDTNESTILKQSPTTEVRKRI